MLLLPRVTKSTVDDADSVPAMLRFLPGPTGLGTAAARIPSPPTGVVAATPARTSVPGGPTGLGTSGLRVPSGGAGRGGAVPELYGPGPVRDDRELGDAVNEDLVDWVGEVGIYAEQLDQFRAANVGRLIMLTHPDTDDRDRLLAAAKCATAEFAVDDHYCDDESIGAAVELLGPRLAIASAAVDPAHLPVRYAPELERAMRDDPVRVALRSALEHLTRYASTAQVARLRHEIAAMFVAFGAEAGWRTGGTIPPVWEYLMNRQPNSFLPCISIIDAVGGYEVSAGTYAEPRVRRAVTMAATASVLLNDLYSMAKESSAAGQDFNLPMVIAAEERCSLDEAVKRSADIHDELVHTFEAEAAALSLDASPALRRYLAGVWAWLGGNHEWHRSSARYHSA